MENWWNELTKRDGLIVVRWIASTIHQFKFVKILLILHLLIHTPCQILQIYLFVNHVNVQEFVQYSPAFFFNFYGMLGAIILLTDGKVVHNLFEEVEMLTIDDHAFGTTKSQIKKEIKIVSVFIVINTIGTIICTILINVCNAYDYTTYLPIKYITDYWAEYLTVFSGIYKASYLFAGIVVNIAHCFQVIYYTQNVRYQMLMLIDQIKQITQMEESDSFNGKLVDDVDYQEQVKLRLINTVKRTAEITIPLKQKIIAISNYIVYFGICGLFCLLSMSLALFTMDMSNLQYDYRYIPIAALLTVITFLGMIKSGQSIEDVSENLYESLKQINWYNMNVENRKMYLIALCYAQRTIRIQFSENYSVNYVLGLTIVRTAYSIMTVLVGFSKAQRM